MIKVNIGGLTAMNLTPCSERTVLIPLRIHAEMLI